MSTAAEVETTPSGALGYPVREPYESIPRRVLQPSPGTMSLRELGLITHLLSRPPGWRSSATRLAQTFKEGRDAIETALRGLEKVGLLSRERIQFQSGQWGWVWLYGDDPAYVAAAKEAKIAELRVTGELRAVHIPRPDEPTEAEDGLFPQVGPNQDFQGSGLDGHHQDPPPIPGNPSSVEPDSVVQGSFRDDRVDAPEEKETLAAAPSLRDGLPTEDQNPVESVVLDQPELVSNPTTRAHAEEDPVPEPRATDENFPLATDTDQELYGDDLQQPCPTCSAPPGRLCVTTRRYKPPLPARRPHEMRRSLAPSKRRPPVPSGAPDPVEPAPAPPVAGKPPRRGPTRLGVVDPGVGKPQPRQEQSGPPLPEVARLPGFDKYTWRNAQSRTPVGVGS